MTRAVNCQPPPNQPPHTPFLTLPDVTHFPPETSSQKPESTGEKEGHHPIPREVPEAIGDARHSEGHSTSYTPVPFCLQTYHLLPPTG